MTPRVLMMGEYVPSGDEGLAPRICETHHAIFFNDTGCHRCQVADLPVEEQEAAAQQAILDEIRREQALILWIIVPPFCALMGLCGSLLYALWTFWAHR